MSEIFQWKMQETLQGLEGVEVFMDDILIYGTSMGQHNFRLERVPQRVVSRPETQQREMLPQTKPAVISGAPH